MSTGAILSQTLSQLGGETVIIAEGEYTGTNVYGSSNKNSLTFDFVPDVVYIVEVNNSTSVQGFQCILYPKIDTVKQWSTAMGANTNQNNITGRYLNISMEGNTLSWYGYDAPSQMNKAKQYHWWAFGRVYDNLVSISCLNSDGSLQDGCVVIFGENEPVISNSSTPISLHTSALNPTLTVIAPLDYGGATQTQTLDFSTGTLLEVSVNIDTSEHLTYARYTSNKMGAFSSQINAIDVFAVGGGQNGIYFEDTVTFGSTPALSAFIGGSGAGGARTNNINTLNNIFDFAPGKINQNSSISNNGEIICQAQKGSTPKRMTNSKNTGTFTTTVTPGIGTIGDVLMTGDAPVVLTANFSGSFDSQYYDISGGSPVVGNVYSLKGEKLSGAGNARSNYRQYYSGGTSVVNRTTRTWNGTAGGAVNEDENATTYGSSAGTYSYVQSLTSPTYGQPGMVEWQLHQS